MKSTMLFCLFGLLFIGTNLYAANGDLIVNGNLGVGVGAASPAEKMQVHLGPDLNIGISQNTYPVISSHNDAWSAWGNLQLNNSMYLIGSTGNVGIGTTEPSKQLHIRGDTNGVGIKLENQNATKTWGLVSGYYNGNDGLFIIYDYTVPRIGMLIDTNGNVGIGMPNPSQKLDVAGSVASNHVVLTSDAKFKKDVKPISDSLNTVLKLRGVSYEWKKDEYKDKNFSEGRHYGVIAQEIEKILPEVVSTDPDGMKGVAYIEIIPVLIEAIKEQQMEIEQLKKMISEK